MSIYMGELVHQAETLEIAAGQFNEGLHSRDSDNVRRIFAAVQSLLGAAAMMSKLLKPDPPGFRWDGSPLSPEETRQRKLSIDRGKQLRDALLVKGDHPITQRSVRNAFEHFDDRLDRYLEANPTASVVDLYVGPAGGIVVDPPIPYLRHVDNETLMVSVLDKSVNIQSLYDAAKDVGDRARHWIGGHFANLRPLPGEAPTGSGTINDL